MTQTLLSEPRAHSPSGPVPADSLDGCTGVWWVVATRPQYDEKLLRDLRWHAADGRAIIVRERVLRDHTDRNGHHHRRWEERNAFSGYVFANGNIDFLYACRASNATSEVIEVKDQRRLARELSAVMRSLQISASLGAMKYRPGQRVRIVDHPFASVDGEWTVTDARPDAVCLNVRTLGQLIPFEIAPEFVELLN